MERPSCVVQVWDLPGEQRPRFTKPVGVGAVVRALGDVTGLTRMGVALRVVQPGLAGTNRHYHTVEEEWSYVVSGSGAVRIGPLRLPVRAGSFVAFPPGPRPHHFIAEGAAPLVFLEGGERRRAQDFGYYPDLKKKFFSIGKLVELIEELPPEEGEPTQCVHIDDLPMVDFQHDVDPGARRVMRSLHRPAGLVRQAVRWSRVQPGARSTAFHTHERTDEWVFVLAGRARVRVGDDTFEVGTHDFLGHPAGGPAHVMEPLEPLTYLMGGEINPEDVVIYPDAGVRRVVASHSPLRKLAP